jgi:hypothetical protein
LKLHSEISSAQIHGFSDASQLAMAAVVYIRVTNQHSSSIVTLVCSKTKVAPLKRLTIPWLELSAAALLAKLVKRVQVTLELQKVPVFTWTDSSATLAWIKGNPMRWKEFVGNRVSLIQETLPEAHWKFISGKQNPADCASRGLSASQLIHHPLWWTGPAWLSQPPEFWPSKIPPENLHDDLEQRPGLSYAAVIPESPAIWDLIELKEVKTFNKTLTKLLRLTALVQRAWSCFKRIPNSKLSVSPINLADLENAKFFWIKTTQQAYYSSEFKILQAGKRLKESHALSRLTAIIDHAGILRVGGRLQNSQLDADSKHPAILPKESQLAQLIISHAHSRTMHGGTQLTLSLIRKSCWIVGGRAPVKSFIQKCLTCARIRGVRAQQLMGQLPASRVTPSLVFENSGVDYAGPVSLKFNQGRGTRFYKGWIAVFVCLSTSAIHLEVATDYSSEAFIKAYRRFISRRGICKILRSDCGTNFKGADVLLKKLFNQSTHQFKELQRLLTNDGTRWIFNPPGAPHMGGKWEAAVKSVKHHLRRTIAETHSQRHQARLISSLHRRAVPTVQVAACQSNSNSPRCGWVNSGSDDQDSYRHTNKTSNKTRFVTNFNMRGKLRQFSGKSSSSRRTRRLIAANNSPNLLEKAGRMFEIPANFNWRGLKDGVGNTVIIIIIDIIINTQTDRRRKIIRKSLYKAVIIVNHHYQ